MMSARSIVSYVVLAVIAAASWWFAESMTPKEANGAKPDAGPVDYYSHDVRRTRLDETGKPKEVLVAATMTHYKNDDHTELDKPVMTLFNSEGHPPWIIDADSGVALSDGKAIFLNGDVLITRKTDSGEEFKIITRNVKYVPGKQYAETSEDALMLGPHDELSGKGMQVQFEPDLIVNILADVRRKHEMR